MNDISDRLRQQVLDWIDDDPDPVSRSELSQLVNELPGSTAELADRFSGRLRFGTAGLRGPLRAGPNGMNLAVVRATAAGLVAWLTAHQADGCVVIGYDARHGSKTFAWETARVVTGDGRQALLLPRPLPTPVLATVVRACGASAGVMVTASHNPAQDNGYKVYLGRELGGETGAGAQLIPPADAEIEAATSAVGRLAHVALGPIPVPLAETVIDTYIRQAACIVRHATVKLKVAYTPLHGVGRDVFCSAMLAAGFPEPIVVAEQSSPDPDFPTVAFPNPEEPGATDLLLALAQDCGADLAIAHDPDADRCAVASASADGTWRMLRGDELGILLADHLIRRGVHGRFATTIVSSTMLSRLCGARRLPYGETLTGFKWIVRSGEDLVFGYEEALGYCVMPSLVRDKDGITAALLACDLVAELASRGLTLSDRLDELATEFGVHVTDQLSIRLEHPSATVNAMAAIRQHPPENLAGQLIVSQNDHLPDADVISFHTACSRVVVRPSGTEPKLKAYLEIVEPATDGDITSARTQANLRLAALRDHISAILDFSRSF